MSTMGRPHTEHPLSKNITLAIVVIVWLILAWAGAPYYQASMAERVHSQWHSALKPTGTVGLIYGYVGTFFLVLLFVYSVRKRVRFLRGLGSIGSWLHVHILCGFAGPAFVTLHCAFKVKGAIALGYWAMICVMLSGCVGYYIYRQIPRERQRGKVAAGRLSCDFEALTQLLQRRYGLSEENMQAMSRAAGVHLANKAGPLRALVFFLFQDILLFLKLLPLRLKIPELRKMNWSEARIFRDHVRNRVALERRLAFLNHSEMLLGYWHAFHKPFSIILYIMVMVHIGIAVWMGYAWL